MKGNGSMGKNQLFFNWRKENEVRGKTYEGTDHGLHRCIVEAVEASEAHPRTLIIVTKVLNGQKKLYNTFLNGLMSPEGTVRIQNEMTNGASECCSKH